MMGSQGNIRKEDVVQKLKDDGDFDRLRLMIIRKLKDKQEELRNSIISMVKQSEALNHAGNENLKPRQFCDAIYKEIQTEAMNHISDRLWEIIRSDDGKSEITKTVQSVYNKLVNPKGNEEGNSSSPNILAQFQNGTGNNSFQKAPASEINDPMSDNELNEPPGFSMSNTHQSNSHGEQKGEQQQPMPSERGPTEEHKEGSNHPLEVLEPHDVDHGVPPGFSAAMENSQPCDGSDEDPDVPPGFG
ncbi:uncharacterized protein LOC100265102 isoform X1 [Vitis vinifera]|nr:uncharacterized protein LOC100265102 isoform X1 [Vitis vinifera]|eukprot:XP_010661520.1 PREDICTED: uncharacterized protein LOC100265102 isoform X1 [Vitis vinifera]